MYGIVFNFQVSDKGFPNEEEEKFSNKNITLEIWDVNDEFPIFIKPLETVFVSDVSTYIRGFTKFEIPDGCLSKLRQPTGQRQENFNFGPILLKGVSSKT